MIVFPISFIQLPTASFTSVTFTEVGTTSWIAPEGVTSLQYLVVGGGGGGGNGYDSGGGGGGGGGMVLTGTLSVTPGQSYTIVVGDGGIGGADTRTNNNGTTGANSVFSSITALGGGGGGGSRTNNPGPAGVGAGIGGTVQIGSTAAPSGGNGGAGGNAGGGGGGAGGAGTARTNASTPGVGGTGIASSISGESTTYGSGGNGGSANVNNNDGTTGSPNTGNGGGAGSATSGNSGGGGNGGSGIVILRRNSVVFSQTFTMGQAPGSTIENAWTTFRSQLTGSYTTMSISNNLGASVTVTDANVQSIANALRTATTGTNFSVTIGSRTWRVIQGCVAGTADANSIYLTSSGTCDCGGGTTFTVRPMIKNANWGGLNGSACGSATQTITVEFS